MPQRTFAARIVAWQRAHGRHDLPWQRSRDAYRIWLSEIMLQQTQVIAVLPYYERFVQCFPDVHALAAAPLDRVLELWSGLGYYRRAHYLHAAAKAVVERHGGEFPRDVAALSALPGIGRSTAGAIAAFAYGAHAPILDGNVKRVLARHRAIDDERRLWEAAEALLPAKDIERYTQGLMDLGATVCVRTPRCAECPVATDCIARIEERIASLPRPRAMRKLPQRAVRLLVIERAGEILFERRPPTGVWAGLWSLPEVAVDADVRERLRTQFGLELRAVERLAPIVHGFTHFMLTMYPERVQLQRSPGSANGPDRVWLTSADALSAALPAPIRRLVRSLAR